MSVRIFQLMCVSSAVRAKQQAKMAEYCRTIFGDALLIDPLEKYPVRLTCSQIGLCIITPAHHLICSCVTLIKVCVRSQTVVLSQCCSSRKSAKNMHGSGSGSGSTQARGPGTGLGYCIYLSAPAKTCNRFIMCAV